MIGPTIIFKVSKLKRKWFNNNNLTIYKEESIKYDFKAYLIKYNLIKII